MAIMPDLEEIERGDVLTLQNPLGRKGRYRAVVLYRRGFHVELSHLVPESKKLDFREVTIRTILSEGRLSLKGVEVRVVHLEKGSGKSEADLYGQHKGERLHFLGELLVNGIFLFRRE